MTTTTDHKVLIPEVTVPIAHEADRVEALAMIDSLTPQVARLADVVRRLRTANDEAMMAMARAGIPTDVEETHELVGHATGWYLVWEEVNHLLGPLGSDVVEISDITPDETHRGERNFPPGTRAMVAMPDDGPVVEMHIVDRPRVISGGNYTVVDADGNRYLCSHEEFRAGLIVEEAQEPATV
jgi:hypothetical protein